MASPSRRHPRQPPRLQTTLQTTLQTSVARSLGLPPALLPHVSALFAGLDSLGSDPALVVRLLRKVVGTTGTTAPAATPTPTILDLACGKGGAAVAIAQCLRTRGATVPPTLPTVLGIDACPAFIAAARTLANEKSVADRCRFQVGGVREFRSATKFSIALMLGLFGVEDAAPLLRKHLAPGGLYVVDDAVRDEPARRLSRADRQELAGIPTLAQSRRVFTGLGDEIVLEHVPTRAVVATFNRRLAAKIATRCTRLRKARPNLAHAIDDFLDRQHEANALLNSAIRPAIWIVRRN